jgi:hypothetical protein
VWAANPEHLSFRGFLTNTVSVGHQLFSSFISKNCLRQRVQRVLQQPAMHALAKQTSNPAAAHRTAAVPAAHRLRRYAWKVSAHASSSGMQPVAGTSPQQLHTNSSTNGQQQPAQQQPNRIMRYAGLAADDFRCVLGQL